MASALKDPKYGTYLINSGVYSVWTLPGVSAIVHVASVVAIEMNKVASAK